MSQTRLEPAVRDTCDRLRKNSQRLQNGQKSDPAAIASAVADIGYLLATFFEAEPTTKADCMSHKHEVELMLNKFNQGESRQPMRGINWPTAATIISIVIAILTVVFQVF